MSVDEIMRRPAQTVGELMLQQKLETYQRSRQGVVLERDALKKQLQSVSLYEQHAKDESVSDQTKTFPTLVVPSLIVNKRTRIKFVKHFVPESMYMYKKRVEKIEAEQLTRLEQLEQANQPHEKIVNVMLRDQ